GVSVAEWCRFALPIRLPGRARQRSAVSSLCGNRDQTGTPGVLGLAIIKNFVEAHGGQGSIESRKGMGTKFRLHFLRKLHLSGWRLSITGRNTLTLPWRTARFHSTTEFPSRPTSDDQKAEIRQVSAVFTQERFEDAQTKKSRHV